MKKHYILSLMMVAFTISVQAQYPGTEKCGTMHSLDYRLKNDPATRKHWDEYHSKKAEHRGGSSGFDTTGFVIIPVVFHVVYNPANPSENIPDSVIFSQLEVLNRDYAYSHPFTSATLPVFDSIAANTGVRFCLASVDPDGNPTTGITRTSSTTNHFLTVITQSVKSDAAGGKSPWPTNKYFNLWSCNMFPGLLGYAQFPGDNPLTDGVVLAYAYVGENPGAPTAPNNLGRTATHEGGHWLGMRHIWGDGGCGVEDGIDDTPDSDAASSQDCELTRNNCTDAGNMFWGGYDPVDMVQNFMDYSADGCMTLFTRQQTNKMWHHIVDDRDSLFYSNGCGAPKINGYVITRNITCPTSCDGQSTVTVMAGTPPYNFLWDDALAQTSATATGLCKGTYTVRVIDADNDTMYIQAFVNTQNNLTALASTANATVCGHYGNIEINAMAGVIPYAYSIDGGSSFSVTNVFTNLPSGTYPVVVKDVCATEITFDVVVDSVFITATETHVDDACGNCGSITVTATGGNGGYTYTLDTLAPQTSNNFTGLTAGTYTLVVTDTCGNTDTLEVIISNTIGLTEQLEQQQVLIYPNPVSTVLNVRFSQFVQNATVRLLDVTGKQVRTINLNGNTNLIQLDISMLEKGIYFMEFGKDRAVFHTERFVKQ